MPDQMDRWSSGRRKLDGNAFVLKEPKMSGMVASEHFDSYLFRLTTGHLFRYRYRKFESGDASVDFGNFMLSETRFAQQQFDGARQWRGLGRFWMAPRRTPRLSGGGRSLLLTSLLISLFPRQSAGNQPLNHSETLAKTLAC